jgi:hypothetical protein
MKKSPPPASPEEFVKALRGWRRKLVDSLCEAVRGAAAFGEGIKWGNLVFDAGGPAVVLRAEERRVLFILLRGQRLTHVEPRLRGSGKFELASIELREGDTLAPARARRLAREAAALNRALGDPTKPARPARASARTVKAARQRGPARPRR